MAPFKTNVHLQFDGSFQDKHTLFMFVRPTLQKHGQVFLFLWTIKDYKKGGVK